MYVFTAYALFFLYFFFNINVIKSIPHFQRQLTQSGTTGRGLRLLSNFLKSVILEKILIKEYFNQHNYSNIVHDVKFGNSLSMYTLSMIMNHLCIHCL